MLHYLIYRYSNAAGVTPMYVSCWTYRYEKALGHITNVGIPSGLGTGTKAHDWMVSVLGPLFRTAGHQVRTQFGVTAIERQKRGDVDSEKPESCCLCPGPCLPYRVVVS